MLRIVVIAAVLISVFATGAEAQSFGGWGAFGFSGVTVRLDLQNVPNPQQQKTVVTLTAATGDIEFFCAPKGKPGNVQIASPGAAGGATVSFESAISKGEFSQTNSTATQLFFIDLSQAVSSEDCTSAKMDPIDNSEATLEIINATAQAFRCPTTELTPECTLRDTVSFSCFLDNSPPGGDGIADTTVLRNPDLTTVSGANTFTCPEQ